MKRRPNLRAADWTPRIVFGSSELGDLCWLSKQSEKDAGNAETQAPVASKALLYSRLCQTCVSFQFTASAQVHSSGHAILLCLYPSHYFSHKLAVYGETCMHG